MASLSVDGLISGLDTTSLISQLISAESTAQTRLKTQLSTTQAAASAYRSVNTKLDAVRTAAEALTTEGLAAARTATSSNASVTASATSSAVAGSRISFTVTSLAKTASYASTTVYSSTEDVTATAEPSWPLEITRPDGSTATIDVPAGTTLAAAVAKINNTADLGVKANALRAADGSYRLQLTSGTPGAAGHFTVRTATEAAEFAQTGATTGSAFTQLSAGRNAELDLGNSLKVTSATNTFADLMTGVSVTVTAEGTTPVVVEVAEDPKSVAAKVKTLVDAVNAALAEIRRHSNSATGSTAVLKGDTELRTLTNKLLQNVSEAVSGAGSPASIGIELKRDGTVVFDEKTFLATLQSSPETAQRLLTGSGTPAVEGISQRLADLADRATNSTTGSLTLLAKGRDTLAKDFQDRIADWDLRLAARKETLTRQFTAMETALNSLKNQSTWLAGQLGSLSG